MHIDVSLSALPGEENPDVLLGSKREWERSSIKSSKINENIYIYIYTYTYIPPFFLAAVNSYNYFRLSY